METTTKMNTSEVFGGVKGFTVKPVTFKSNGLSIAGLLHTPDNLNGQTAALVVGHPGTGVKEQTSGLYARLMAAKGYITLAFDAAFQGESEGIPRGLEDPSQRTEDIKSAVSYLSMLKEVDADRIAVLGICASGGYGINAAATDHRIKSIATVCPVDIGRQFRCGGDGKQDPAIIQSLLDAAAADRTSEAKGNGAGSFYLFPTEEQARAVGGHFFEGWEYYISDRGQHPRSLKNLTWNSIDRIAGFDAFHFANMISPRPLLLIAGTKAETLWMTDLAYELANEPKEKFLIEGATHVDLYDKEEFVEPAIEKIVEFFKKTLI